MKKIILLLCCFIAVSAQSQNREIEFASGDWNSQLATAKQNDKLIFFDAYTTWCAPCKIMARDVFTKDEVADLFNDKFVNVKFDMEKGEGLTLKDTYAVSAFPTYLFINGDGELVHKIVGSMSASEFVTEAHNALNPDKTVHGLAKKFEASGHSEESAIAYFEALNKAYEADELSIASKMYFDALPQEKLLEEHYWELALKYLNNPSSSAFAYLYHHKQNLKNTYNTNVVDNYFLRVMNFAVGRIKKSYAQNSGVNEAKENGQAIRELLKEETSHPQVLLAKLDLIEYAAANQWDKFVTKMDSICLNPEFSDKEYMVIEAANDVVTLNMEDQYKNVLRWADCLEANKPGLFTQIQLAEVRKRVFNRQEKTKQAEAMAQLEKDLRQQAADKGMMSPTIQKY